MKRIILATVMWFGANTLGWAQSIEQNLIAGLQAQGYVILESSHTFLGRLRIVAENDQIHRELVVNPGTGEVLRDYAVLLAQMVPPESPPPGSSHKSSVIALASNVPTGPAPALSGSTQTQTSSSTEAAAGGTTGVTVSATVANSGVANGVVNAGNMTGAVLPAGTPGVAPGPTLLLVDPIISHPKSKP